ncbi:MAG: LysR family transcriptional regulator, partial [Limnohabitans sp.]
MEPKHLIQLETILECGSMNKASQLLHLTQPTLTHNMQALEVRAGGKLFERGRFGVRSTALGEVLAREGRAIARRLRDAGEACARHRDGIGQTLRIGTGPLVGAALIPRLLNALSSAAPRRA